VKVGGECRGRKPLKGDKGEFVPLKSDHGLLRFGQHTLFLTSASDYQYERQDFCRSGLFDLTEKESLPHDEVPARHCQGTQAKERRSD
jgi:hypothetical protein